MANGIQAQASASHPGLTESACALPWCSGASCAPDNNGEQFHQATLTRIGDGASFAGIELVRNDFGDGLSTGTLVEITWSDLANPGVTVYSVLLRAEQAHALSVAAATAARLAGMA